MQFTGLKSLGLDTYYPGLTDYEAKWIHIDSEFVKSLGEAYTDTGGDTELNPKSPSREDYSEAARAVSGLVASNVLTSDTGKSLLKQKKFIAKEEIDGIKAYHYQAEVNPDNITSFCQAMMEKITATKLYSKLYPDATDDDKQDVKKECQDSLKHDDDHTYDIWIDAKYKLIHNVRTYSDDGKSYTDFGQTYTGGDTITFFLRYHSEDYDAKASLELNSKSRKSTMTIDVSSAEKDQVSVKGSLSLTPYEGNIDTTPPAGAIPIKDVLKKLQLDY